MFLLPLKNVLNPTDVRFGQRIVRLSWLAWTDPVKWITQKIKYRFEKYVLTEHKLWQNDNINMSTQYCSQKNIVTLLNYISGTSRRWVGLV